MGKERVLNAIKNQPVDRVPWVPFVGCHGAALLGVTAEQYLKSSEWMVKGVREAIRRYQPDGIPVAFDLQIEAEALGCGLNWAKDNPPAVVSHVLEQVPLESLSLPSENDGRIPEVMKAARTLRAEFMDLALYGLVTGPFTLALHLKGTEIFMAMYDQPEEVHRLLRFCTEVAQRMASYYVKAGCDVVAVVDPMTSQISPATFRSFVTEHARKLFGYIRELGACSSFFVCGHAEKNVEAMCETGPDNVSVDENIPLGYVKEVCQRFGISFGGNLQLTVVLLFGDADSCRVNALQCLDIGGGQGFILAPGCDVPYAVPPENLEAVTEIVQDAYARNVARALLDKQSGIRVEMDLTDYGKADRIVLDVITLDSEACAPCQYMVEAVRAVLPHFGNLVVIREHKIKEKESVEFMMAMMVKNVPTICIDGKIKFVSLIPTQEELIAAIQERINEKFNLQLRHKKSRILVLGAGCDRCQQTLENVQKARKELGSTVEVVHLSNEQEIYRYGVMSTPAVVVSREQVKCTGRIPSVEVIKEWLKDLA